MNNNIILDNKTKNFIFSQMLEVMTEWWTIEAMLESLFDSGK